MIIRDKAQALIEVGIDPCELNNANRPLSRVSSATKRRRNNNGWIITKPDGSLIVGNWEAPFQEKTVFCPSSDGLKLHGVELRTARQLQKVQQAIDVQNRKKQQREKSKLASFIWKQSSQIKAESQHPYFVKKQVNASETVREINSAQLKKIMGYSFFAGRILIFPLKYENQIASIQFISESGEKRFLKDARKDGCFWQTNKCEHPSVIAIAEGMATILSVIQHAKTKMIGISALDAGNLPKVAKDIPDRWSEAEKIIIYGDNDKNGAGQASAQEAVRILEGKGCDVQALIPEFTEEDVNLFQKITNSDKDPSDWNDYYIIHDALDAVGNGRGEDYDK